MRMRTKKGSAVKMRIRVESRTYTLIQKAASKAGCEAGEAVRAAIERGMQRYWDMWFEVAAKDLRRQQERLEIFERDNKILTRLMKQNYELERMIAESGGAR